MDKTNSSLNRDKQFKESVVKDSLEIIALYFLTVFVIYKLPALIGYILFMAFFILFYKSKKDYFWLAFFFILNTGPGGFFYVTEEVTTGQLPNFLLGGGINISSTEIFLGIAIFKALTRGRKKPIPLSKPLLMIMVYSFFMFMVSIFVFGTSSIRFLKDLRYFFYYFSIVPLGYLVYRQEEGEKLLYCIFPFVFITFFSGFYFILKGDYFIHLLAPGLREQSLLGIEGGGIRFNISGKGEHLVLLISYIASLFLSFREARLKRKNLYYLLVAGIGFITLLLTATRLWFVVFSFIFAAGVLFLRKNPKMVGGMLIIAVLLYMPYLLIPKIHDFADRSLTRIESILDINREGSISYKMIEYKKKYRLSKTLEGIQESPLIGWGSSSQFYSYTGGPDIGNFNLVLQVGIIGFLLFVNFWVRFFLMISKVNKKLSPGNPYRGTILLFNISLTALLIAHFTTHQVFSMIISQGYSVFIMLFVFLSGYFSKEALRLEYFLKSSADSIRIQGAALQNPYEAGHEEKKRF